MPKLDHAYYAERAAAAQALADTAEDDDSRIIHLRIAKDYAELAALTLPPAPVISDASK